MADNLEPEFKAKPRLITPLIILIIAIVIIGIVVIFAGKVIVGVIIALLGAVFGLGAQVSKNNKL